MRRRIKHIAIAIDQLLYVFVTLGAGYPDETLSAASWRWEQSGKRVGRIVRPAIDFLAMPFEKDHCQSSYASELLRKQLPDEYRKL